VGLYWVPGHAGVCWKEIADKLTRGGSTQKFIRPEPSLGVSRQNFNNKIKHWVDNQHLAMWCGPCSTQRQAWKLISGPSLATKAWLLSSNRTKSRVINGLLTGHNTLKRHLYAMRLSSNPTCRKCGTEEEMSVHILCECEALASLRQAYLGSFFLDPEDVMYLSRGPSEALVKEQGSFYLVSEYRPQRASLKGPEELEPKYYSNSNQCIQVTDGLTVTLCSASLQHNDKSNHRLCMPHRVKLKITAYCLCQIQLNWTLSCEFKKWCQFSNRVKRDLPVYKFLQTQVNGSLRDNTSSVNEKGYLIMLCNYSRFTKWNNKGTILADIFPCAFHNNVRPISLNIMFMTCRLFTNSHVNLSKGRLCKQMHKLSTLLVLDRNLCC